MGIGKRLQTAGKHLIQGNIGLAAKSMVVDVVNSASFRGSGIDQGGMWFFGNNGIDLHFNYSTHQSAIDAFTKCSPITSIILKKGQAFINGIPTITNTKGTESNTPEAKKLKALLKNPNPLQTWKQFEAQMYTYQQLFGYTIVLPIKPFGFPNIDATALWNIPPYMVDIKETNKLFYENPKRVISQIILTYKSQKYPINIEDILIIEDFTPNFSSLVIPDSRIKALQMPINNIIGAYEARNVLINYRGALGILSPEIEPAGTMIMNATDKAAIQTDFARYGLKKSQWQVIITNQALKWQQMGYPTKDLMLFEEIEDDVMKICDQFNYPYRLLSQEKSASYNDVKEFKKLLYQDAIIPEADSFYEQLNQFFGLEELNLVLKKDFRHIQVLQDDIKTMAETRKALSFSAQMDFLLNAITLNQYRRIVSLSMSIKIDETPDGEVYYSDIKDLIGKATLKAGEISQIDPGDEATTEEVKKLWDEVLKLKESTNKESLLNIKNLENKINSLSKDILFLKNKSYHESNTSN